MGEGFGQRERLTVRLRGLLRSYPRSIGIIKELLQNADDAGASQVSITWDERELPHKHLPDPRMSRVQGPALLVANNQLFSDVDFEAIRSIGESSKAALGPKTGRFGLGFNTVYNVTDYPSFVSGRWAVAFDPHRDAIAEHDAPTGRRWNLSELQPGGSDWLLGFSSAGLKDSQHAFPGTIFRLPARTQQQANESEICDQAFCRADFEQILRDLQESGDELLLFARNLLDVEVREVTAQGVIKQRLTITTRNRDEVVSQRAIGNEAVEGDTRENLISWHADADDLPNICYRHQLSVVTPNAQEVRAWQVVAGLFTDHAGILLRINKEMLNLGEKALPWVGAAIRLDLREDGSYAIARQQGKLFCTFPLPDQSSLLPCHINGCFDLDPSRRHISTDAELYAEADRVRVAWNRELLKHAAPQAAALAIAALVPDAAANGMSRFFSLWPALDKRTREPWQGFNEALLRRLSKLPLIRTRAGTTEQWQPLATTPLPPSLWGEDLLEALRDDGLRFPDPDLPRRLVRNVETSRGATQRCRPKQIREWLRVEEPLELAVSEAPRRCLRERSHLIDLLQFCISDQKNDLTGLPLALGEDGQLRAFGRGHSIFLADADTRKLFAAKRALFIAARIQNNTRLRPCPEASLRQMDFPEVLAQLAKILGGDDTPLSWNPAGEALPNQAWVTDVIRFLQARAHLLAPESLDGLALLPDQRGHLHAINSARPRLLATDSLAVDLVPSLAELGIDVVTAQPPLIDALRNFQRKFPHTMVPLSATSLVHELGRHRQALLELPGHAPARARLLDYLSSPSSIDSLDPPALTCLRSLAVLETTSGRTVAASHPGIYLASAQGIPPGMEGTFELVDTGPRGRWRDFVLALGVAELDRPHLLAELFLHQYPTLTRDAQRDALTWLRDTVDLQMLASSAPALFEQLRGAPLILAGDGRLHPAQALYITDGNQPIEQSDLTPDRRFYRDEDGGWGSFFARLGVRQEPHTVAITRHLDALCTRANEALEDVGKVISSLIPWLEQTWFQLRRSDPDEADVLVAKLRERAWLPPLRDSPLPGFTPPQARLYRAQELVCAEALPLVASQIAALGPNDCSPEFLDVLGIQAPTPDVVAAHLTTLSRRWSEPGHHGLTSEALTPICKAIYTYFGRIPAQQALPDTLKTSPCIWDGSRFWLPSHAFAVPIADLFGDRRGFVPGIDDDRHGLDRLGRRTHVKPRDIGAYLDDLLNEGKNKLSSDEVARTLRLLERYFADQTERDPQKTVTLPVPTRDGFLVASSQVFVDDAPWLLARLSNAPITLLHSSVRADTIRQLGIRRLSSVTFEELATAPAMSTNNDKVAFCRELTKTIHHSRFAAGLARLAAMGHEGERIDTSNLLGLRLRAVDRLVTHLKIKGLNKPYGRQEVEILADDSASTVYVSADHWSTVVLVLAETINRLVGRRIDNLAHLEAILQTPPTKIREVLDHRKVPRLPGFHELDLHDAQDDVDESFFDALKPPAAPRVSGTKRLAVVDAREGPRLFDQAALNECIQFEEKAGRRPIAMPADTKTHDIQSGRISDPEARLIRVYAPKTTWDRHPVILSQVDALAARTFGPQYWLYIVEGANDPRRRRIFRLQDPFSQIASYAFNESWKTELEQDDPGNTPRVGWLHSPKTGRPAKILAVETVGTYTWLRVQVGGSEERRFFRPTLDRVTRPR